MSTFPDISRLTFHVSRLELYSYGDSSGITPDSLFNHYAVHKEPAKGANVYELV